MFSINHKVITLSSNKGSMGSKRSHLNCSSLTISRDIFRKFSLCLGIYLQVIQKYMKIQMRLHFEFGLIVQGGRNQERTCRYGKVEKI